MSIQAACAATAAAMMLAALVNGIAGHYEAAGLDMIASALFLREFRRR